LTCLLIDVVFEDCLPTLSLYMRCHAQIKLCVDLNNSGWGGARDPSTFWAGFLSAIAGNFGGSQILSKIMPLPLGKLPK
jgi:hypothetical protein